MTLYRCFAWNTRADRRDQDGPLWFPRPVQGEGRHDNPDLYGCLYLADRPLSAVVEQMPDFADTNSTTPAVESSDYRDESAARAARALAFAWSAVDASAVMCPILRPGRGVAFP